jgi:hypothetical protein
LLRAQIAQHEASARTQDSKGGAQCPHLVAEVVERQLAADEIEIATIKRERGGVGQHPENIRRLGTGLLKHAQRPVDAPTSLAPGVAVRFATS